MPDRPPDHPPDRPPVDPPRSGPEPFAARLVREGLQLRRAQLDTLQVNVGRRCNLTCGHCHLEAGPARADASMSARTAAQVLDLARARRFAVVDVTGGETTLWPELPRFLAAVAPLCDRLMLRTNLCALPEDALGRAAAGWAELGVVVVTSMPSVNKRQLEAQRGAGVMDPLLTGLRVLGELGYGAPDSGLELDLVANPSGAFLPRDQAAAERRFRALLESRFEMRFNHMFLLGNVPLGRFRAWLRRAGNERPYLASLAAAFNPCALAGVMCRTLLSVDWDGTLHDCDFNLAAGLPLGTGRAHVSQLARIPQPGAPIAVGDHCYACTAGTGFT